MAKKKKRRNRKKSNIGLVIAITMLVVLVVAGSGIGLYIYRNHDDGPTAEAVYEEYIALLKNGSYEAMYNYVHDDIKQTVTEEEFVTRHSNIYSGIGATDMSFEIIDTEELENRYVIRYKGTIEITAGTVEDEYSMILYRNEEKELKIQWSSQLIFSDLTDQDRVRVNTLNSSRGTIYDRNGTALATDGTAAWVGLVPGKMSASRGNDIEALAQLLEMSADTINDALNQSYVTDDTFVPLRALSKNSSLISQLLEINGVMISETNAREYPLGEKMAHLTGYVQSINAEELEELADEGYNANSIIGKSGLERLYEDRLRGTDGVEIVIVDSASDLKKTLAIIPAENGEDIYLTIDSGLQSELYNQLKDDAGLAVAMNPKTGEVLALVSTPTYDPNDFVNGVLTSTWNELNENENQPFFTRYASTWTPGSVFKPITGAVALANGTVSTDTVEESNGYSWQKDSSWGAFNVTTLETYGSVTFARAMAFSDNIYFAKASMKMGGSAFSQALDNLGFRESVPFTIGMTASSYENTGNIYDDQQLANSGYGQGETLINPLHLASIYSAFVNDGSMIQPYLEMTDDSVASYWKSNVISSSIANTVLDSLILAVEESGATGNDFRISGLKLAGKTGTAEIKASQTDTSGIDLGWFVGMDAEDSSNPLLIAMMIEEVNGRGGSHYVTPRVREAFLYYKGLSN